ncbi:response regulator transcription factor [Magnetococcales bacterium HHB-1]
MEDLKQHILIVEDNEAMLSMLKASLLDSAYHISISTTIIDARRVLENHQVDLILLDINLPDGDGFELSQEIRSTSPWTWIILVTSRKDEIDRITGLVMGADDYITKPFNIREIQLKVCNFLQRSQAKEQQKKSETRAFDGWSLDTMKHQLHDAQGNETRLTHAEWLVLDLLTRNPGRLVLRETFYQTMAHPHLTNPGRTLDVLINRLRRKLGDSARQPRYIATIPRKGFQFIEEVC